MYTIDDLIDTARAAQAEHTERPVNVLTVETLMYQTLGADALGVDGEQWRSLVAHVRTALYTARGRLEFPMPEAVVAAAVLLDVPGPDVASLVEDIDKEVFVDRDHLDQVGIEAAYDHAGRLTTELRSMLFRVTTIRPRTELPEDLLVRDLVSATDHYRRANGAVDSAKQTFYASVRAAGESGMMQPEITRITGLSKPRVYQILGSGK